ncbi:MAG: PD-(D/E)XK nuclease family protein [Acidobacteria bacterium]|nr:PD-(D/E)XK nuclease family protein [Acidobacteriota bacterium]
MKRTIHQSHWPPFDAIASGLEVYTPHRRAAHAVGAPYRTLENEAHRLLEQAGFEPVDSVKSMQYLSAAASEVAGDSDPIAMAARFTPSMQALLRTGADPQELLDYDSERIRQLAQITLGYRERLRAKGLVDPAEALWRAAELGPARRSIMVYGYFRPRIDELALIDAIAGDGSHFILPFENDSLFKGSGQAVDFLRGKGWEIAESEITNPTYGQRIAWRFLEGGNSHEQAAAYSYPSLEAEVRGVLAQVKDLLFKNVQASEIVIVVRDEELYGPTLRAIGWEYGVPVNLLYKIPLDETRLGTWLRLLLDAVTSRCDFEHVARMLMHSMGPGLAVEKWVMARKAHTRGIAGWLEAGIDLSGMDWPERARRIEWVRLLDDAIERFELKMRSAQWPRETMALNQLYASRDALLQFKPDEVITIHRFAGDLKDLFSSLAVPWSADVGGVEVHAPDVLFGARYMHIFVMGMAEGVTPAPVAEDPVLDYFERKRLAKAGIRLESAADVARREAMSFYFMLCAATERITFSYPRILGKDEAIPSAFLKKMGIDVRSGSEIDTPLASWEEVRQAYLRDGSKYSNDQVKARAIHSLTVEERRESTEPHDEYDGVTGLPLDASTRLWSASQLTSIGQCAFRWFAARVLRVSEPEEMEDDLSPALRGILYHKALEKALEGAKQVANPREAALDRLEEAFLEAEKEVVIPYLPAWPAQRAEHISKLKRAIESPEFIGEKTRVIGNEMNFTGEWFGLKVRGYIDRVDRTSGGIVMIDYKVGTGVPAGVKDEQGKATIDIQLPIYLYAAGRALYPGERISGAYYSISKAKVLKTADEGDASQLQQFVERVHHHLRKGSYPVDPDNEWKACTYCDYDPVCRKGDRLNGKRSA